MGYDAAKEDALYRFILDGSTNTVNHGGNLDGQTTELSRSLTFFTTNLSVSA